MLSQTADHALRAILYLAQEPTGFTAPADRIAAALGAPPNYLSKTLRLLSHAGIVRGLRGPTGGFRIEIPPAELTVAQVVEAVDEPQTRELCLVGDRRCVDSDPCEVHRCWTALIRASREPFRRTSIADLLDGRCAEAAFAVSSFSV